MRGPASAASEPSRGHDRPAVQKVKVMVLGMATVGCEDATAQIPRCSDAPLQAGLKQCRVLGCYSPTWPYPAPIMPLPKHPGGDPVIS